MRSKLYFPDPLNRITKLKIRKRIGSSLPSIPTSESFFELATNMVKTNKKAAGRVNSPKAIKSAPMDSEKAAINPKGTVSISNPIHWVKLFPSLSQRELSAISFDQPW